MCEFFKKKLENAVSAIQNVIIMPSLLSLKHEMHQPRPQGFSIKKSPGDEVGNG